MIGTKISATVWQVQYRHRNVQPARKIVLAGEPEKPREEHVTGTTVLTTADPTGADLVDVARMVALGAAATPEHEFQLLHVHRMADVRGLASVETDRLAPVEPAGAALLEATTHHQAEIGRLGHEVLKRDIRIRELEAELASARCAS